MNSYPKFSFHNVVLQPTTACNLNCSYCYVPDRDKNFKMSPKIASRVADIIKLSQSTYKRKIVIVWHSGEPLVTGHKHFTNLLEPFEELRMEGLVEHNVQTNATLIDDEWCEILKKYKFQIGVSIDGYGQLNNKRLNWGGKETINASLRGIDLLKKHNISFGVISVVGAHNNLDVKAFYDFFSNLGCRKLNINIEEKEGANLENSTIGYQEAYKFWSELLNAWYDDPRIVVREFDELMSFLNGTLEITEGLINKRNNRPTNVWPTVSFDGDIVLLSPELMSVPNLQERQRFIIGNIHDNDILSKINNVENLEYYQEYSKGADKCRESCAYYPFCGGGQASNKYYEHGTLNTTETQYCINKKKSLIDAFVDFSHSKKFSNNLN